MIGGIPEEGGPRTLTLAEWYDVDTAAAVFSILSISLLLQFSCSNPVKSHAETTGSHAFVCRGICMDGDKPPLLCVHKVGARVLRVFLRCMGIVG
jgi:hypothetical protein